MYFVWNEIDGLNHKPTILSQDFPQ